MNRERILFVSVVAILALWFFVLRSQEKIVDTVEPGKMTITRLSVRSVDMPDRAVKLPTPGPFTLVTNETPHARPTLPLTAARDMPNIWPPTSRSVSLKYLGRLRRKAKATDPEDKATVQLPALVAGGGGVAQGPQEDRVDQWQSFGRVNKGRVVGVRVKGAIVRAPSAFPKPGEMPRFYRLLILLEIDPAKAEQAGVDGAEVRFSKGGTTVQAFPKEIAQFRFAVAGKQKGWFDGAKVFLKLPEKGFGARKNAGARLLQQGKRANDVLVVGWALHILREARGRIIGGNQNEMRDTLLLELDAANFLNLQELVLGLGFEHLSRFPKETAVLEYMGNILSSRSFGLYELAGRYFERASNSKSAQRSRAGLLIRMGRYDEARELLDGGSAGAGTIVDLLRARVALAQADYATAVGRAEARTDVAGADAAEAHQILGGVAYAKGDAATAARHFTDAINADNRRSTAYSDLGLAYAAQGLAADAHLCFARATELDFENSVTPPLGAAFIKLTLADSLLANDDEETAAPKRQARQDSLTDLTKLLDSNPRDLLVRYFLAYAKEKSGDSEGAAVDLRAILDEDHRYRIAIARLGIVQASRREAGGADGLIRPAIAHLTKAAELNPEDATVAYILGRFLMSQDMQRQNADAYLKRAQELPAPEGDDDLPLWAEAARAALKYRDEGIEERRVRAGFSAVLERVRRLAQQKGEADSTRFAENHPVGKFAMLCRDIVSENSTKVDVEWTFRTRPRDWKFIARNPMKVLISRDKGVHLRGAVDYQGKDVDHNTRLEYCAIDLTERNLVGNNFFELIIEGEIGTDGARVELGIGLVGPGKRRRLGRTGIQLKRNASTGKIDVRLEGGESELFKKDKARNYLGFPVDWPVGKFKIHIKVDDRERGLASIWLNGQNVLATRLKNKKDGTAKGSERCTIFGRGRGNRGISIFAWIEGVQGLEFKDIYISKVTLVRAAK